MKYVSLCDGIGAAHAAWHPLGWRCLWTAEIEPFPAAVVDHHWHLPNLGDITKIKEADLGHYDRPDVLVAGTPCQSFSVAGLRGGLADPRGNLALRFLQLARVLRPRWLVWENVPGVLSSGGGRDFGAILGGMVELGYGLVYRVLDAQYFGVPQRRRRVFVVGYLGDWRRAAAVLFERHSFSGILRRAAKRGRKLPAVARGLGTGGADATRACATHLIPAISPALKTRDYKGPSSDGDGDGAPLIVHALRGEGFDASEDGTGRGTPLVAIPNVAFQTRIARNGRGQPKDITDALTSSEGRTDCRPTIAGSFGVRRLMPVECERLQGFPDGYTAITFRGKPAADAPRYKAIGNSMAVPVMAWIGQRIQAVEVAA